MLDPYFSSRYGARWNPKGVPCLYLNKGLMTAQANYRYRFLGIPVGLVDLKSQEAPRLVTVGIPPGQAVDAFASDGLQALGLPTTCPHKTKNLSQGKVEHKDCQVIGAEAVKLGLNGIDCRSAAPGGNRELAWFPGPTSGQPLLLLDSTPINRNKW